MFFYFSARASLTNEHVTLPPSQVLSLDVHPRPPPFPVVHPRNRLELEPERRSFPRRDENVAARSSRLRRLRRLRLRLRRRRRQRDDVRGARGDSRDYAAPAHQFTVAAGGDTNGPAPDLRQITYAPLDLREASSKSVVVVVVVVVK